MHSMPKCTGNVINTIDTGEKPWFEAFQNFFQIENSLNIKKVMSQNVLTMSIQMKALIWSFPKLFQIENLLNIKKVMRHLN